MPKFFSWSACNEQHERPSRLSTMERQMDRMEAQLQGRYFSQDGAGTSATSSVVMTLDHDVSDAEDDAIIPSVKMLK